ncbi:MAG: rhamnulokinase [Eubacteriales bacterium]|nr:rhamnulokinase [Eubacteriales bacterium]
MKTTDLLAFDIGASNGRGIIARFDGEKITLHRVGGFENNFILKGDMGYWDFRHILSEMKALFQNARQQGFEPACFGIDTWGVDYGLLDNQGELIEDPRAYRSATDQELEAAWEKLDKKKLFGLTGIAALNFNTVYQLYRRVLSGDGALKKARTLLMMPDLLGYYLTGAVGTEYTNATTTGLLDVSTRAWSREITDALGIPMGILTPIDRAGTLRGRLKADIADSLGFGLVPFAAVGTHDTASAVAAIPGEGNFAFCSSGTWSLFGVETKEPVLTDFVYNANFSNEGTVQGGFRPLKNIMGLWLIQECRRVWTKEEGKEYTWPEIQAMARAVPPLQCVVDPDEQRFFAAGGMPKKIQEYCRETGQKVPETIGEIARCVYESLALKYRWAVERLGEIRGGDIQSLNIVGGGIQNPLLNQMAADATGLVTTVGPIEGAALGNALMQAQALGLVKDINEARALARASVETTRYEPNTTQQWVDAYGKLKQLMEASE